MRASRILVADSDPAVHEQLKAGLPSERYEVDCVTDGQAALRRAAQWKPDLLVLDVSLPRMDGVSLVRTLRSRPDQALLPAIFLNPRDELEERISGFRLGSDDFLPKPVKPDELDARIDTALKARQQAERTVHAGEPRGSQLEFSGVLAGFRGSLAQIGLPSLLSLMELERKTGVLVLIIEPEQEKIRIHIRDGRILRARYDKRPLPQNAELIYQLLTRTQGRFDFRPRAVTEDDEIRLATARLLLEGARLLDEETRRRNDGGAG